MIKEGCLDGIDEVYGFHNVPNFDEGDIRVKAGAIMASSTTFSMKITGRGGHGSAPHLVNDVLSCGAAIISSFHTIKSRGIDSRENCVFSVTKFAGGHTMNVFPDEANMLGTIRAYDSKTLQLIKEIGRAHV